MKPDDRMDAGFYGKVRTHGDFVRRGLSAGFVAQWDAWLQRGLVAARERYADDWLRRLSRHARVVLRGAARRDRRRTRTPAC